MWTVIGQTKAVALLERSLQRGSLAHAHLFVGPSHVGKMTLALNLAQALNCTGTTPPCGECASCQKILSMRHADVQVIGLGRNGDTTEARSKTEISIEQIRDLQHTASLPPFEGRYKVFIIEQAELLSSEAANCLLKTLEEPADKVVFILLTANERRLLTTVVSRCQRLELLPLPAAQIGAALVDSWKIEPEKAALLARLAHGCLGWAISAAVDDSLLQRRAERLDEWLNIIRADNEERFAGAARLATQFGQSRDSVREKLDLWLDWWRDLLLTKVGCTDAVTNIDRLATLTEMSRGYTLAQMNMVSRSIQLAERQLRMNANPRLVLEVLMLDIPPAAKSKIEYITN
ncbi:MAG: DNA polymerase III subunit delta' [Chloroflexota bacterium]